MPRFFWTDWFSNHPPEEAVPTPVNLAAPTERDYAKVAEEELVRLATENINLLGKLSHTDICHKCGGLFDSERLTPTLEATLVVDDQGHLISGSTIAPPSRFQLHFFCQGCKTDADIVFKLRQESGHQVEDTKFFSLSDLYFREVDDDGEQLFSVTMDDYAHLFCETCGEYITKATKCAGCRKKKDE